MTVPAGFPEAEPLLPRNGLCPRYPGIPENRDIKCRGLLCLIIEPSKRRNFLHFIHPFRFILPHFLDTGENCVPGSTLLETNSPNYCPNEIWLAKNAKRHTTILEVNMTEEKVITLSEFKTVMEEVRSDTRKFWKLCSIILPRLMRGLNK